MRVIEPDGDGLHGSDLGDAPYAELVITGDDADICARQFVNRWVFLPHQRPAALRELLELVCPTKTQNDGANSRDGGTEASGPSACAGTVDGGQPPISISAETAKPLADAIGALLDDFHLAEFEDVFRDEAKQDREWEGLSANHPRVEKFRLIVQTLQQALREGAAIWQR